MSCYYHPGWYNCLVITADLYILDMVAHQSCQRVKFIIIMLYLAFILKKNVKWFEQIFFFMKMSSLHATGFQFSSYVKDIDESLIYINLLLCTQVVFSTEICCLIQTCCTQVVSFKKCPVTRAHI